MFNVESGPWRRPTAFIVVNTLVMGYINIFLLLNHDDIDMSLAKIVYGYHNAIPSVKLIAKVLEWFDKTTLSVLQFMTFGW